MRVLALASQKGGSGKTTLSGHLAVQAQRAGAGPVVLIDIDPQGSLADWWNEREAEFPAFAQTTVARLAADLEMLRQQGFRLAVIDTPPAITMAIQSVIAVAELIVIPTRPSPHDLRAVGATVDLCDRAGKPLLFVVNGATPKAKITYEAAVALSQHGTVAPVTLHHRTGLCSIDDRRPHGDGSRPQGPVRRRGDRAVDLYLRPAGKELSPHRLCRAERAHADDVAHAGWFWPPGGGAVMATASDSKPMASLSSTLLARKGQAKPAMRPQGYAGFDFGGSQPHDDLGWNDMGFDPGDPAMVHTADMVSITPDTMPEMPAGPPLVVRQQAELERELTVEQPLAPRAVERVERVEPIEPVEAVTLPSFTPLPRAAAGSKGKAAFTLRLDPDRHLRLRLACAVAHKSAQAMVTAALDAFLAAHPAVTDLVRTAASHTDDNSGAE